MLPQCRQETGNYRQASPYSISGYKKPRNRKFIVYHECTQHASCPCCKQDRRESLSLRCPNTLSSLPHCLTLPRSRSSVACTMNLDTKSQKLWGGEFNVFESPADIENTIFPYVPKLSGPKQWHRTMSIESTLQRMNSNIYV
jgi:hypothetical protein